MILIAQEVMNETTHMRGVNLYRYAWKDGFTWPEEGFPLVGIEGDLPIEARACDIQVGPTGGQPVFTVLDLFLQAPDVTEKEVKEAALELFLACEKRQGKDFLRVRQGRVAIAYATSLPIMVDEVEEIDRFIELALSARDLVEGSGFEEGS
jgi:hypothetical protein